MKIDKLNGVVAFNEEYHKYFNIKNPEYVYTSVTTLISKYYEPFDEEFFSFYKAVESLVDESDFKPIKPHFLSHKGKKFTEDFKTTLIDTLGLTAEDVEEARQGLLAQWKAKTENACAIGTAIHLERELEWYDKYDSLVKKRIPGVKGNFYCKQGDFDLDKEKAVMPEFLVYYSCPDNILHMAGQVDLLIKDGNDVHILDFKTNEKGIESKAYFNVKTRSTKKMYYPINKLDDHTMNHYNLQMSIYAFLVQKLRPELNIASLTIIHIDREGVETEYELPYLKNEAGMMLAHYKRQLKKEKELEILGL